MMFVKSVLTSLATFYLSNLVSYENLTLVSALIVGFYTFIYDDLERELRYQFRNIFQDIFIAYSNLLERNKGLMNELETFKKENKLKVIYQRLKYLKKIISFQKKVNRCSFPFCEEIILSEASKKTEADQTICEKHNLYSDKKCPICFEDNEEGLFPLRCMHRLHFKCFKEWIRVNEDCDIRCPICRKKEPLI